MDSHLAMPEPLPADHPAWQAFHGYFLDEALARRMGWGNAADPPSY